MACWMNLPFYAKAYTEVVLTENSCFCFLVWLNTTLVGFKWCYLFWSNIYYGWFYHLIMIFLWTNKYMNIIFFLLWDQFWCIFFIFFLLLFWRFSLMINVLCSYICTFYKGVGLFRKSFKINIYFIKTFNTFFIHVNKSKYVYHLTLS